MHFHVGSGCFELFVPKPFFPLANAFFSLAQAILSFSFFANAFRFLGLLTCFFIPHTLHALFHETSGFFLFATCFLFEFIHDEPRRSLPVANCLFFGPANFLVLEKVFE